MKRILRPTAARTGMALAVVLMLALLGQGAAARPALWQEGEAPSSAAEFLGPSSTLVSYQGTLTDPSGNPVNATVTMNFALYDASSGGTLKWGPETQSVPVTNGLFNVLLGSVTPVDPTNVTGDLWLETKVNSELLVPRERITSVPYAVEAGTLPDGAQTRGSLRVNGNLSQVVGQNWMGLINQVRTDEQGRNHRWAFWHMNQAYGMNSLQIWEYRTDSSGVDCGGNTDDGAICHPRFTILQGGNIGIGTGNPSEEGALQIHHHAVALVLKEADRVGAGSLWRMPLDNGDLRFDVSTNGTDFVNYVTPLTLWDNGSIGCGAITENNLQTEEEQAAGGSDRFEEGDVLCWGIDRLEKCATANDRLVQAVADKSGRPIVIGAEVIKVLGPVNRGDILVASDVPGYAMVNNDPVAGAVIAQALEDFHGEQGIIKAMIRKF
jgi:hypothetical protein